MQAHPEHERTVGTLVAVGGGTVTVGAGLVTVAAGWVGVAAGGCVLAGVPVLRAEHAASVSPSAAKDKAITDNLSLDISISSWRPAQRVRSFRRKLNIVAGCYLRSRLAVTLS